VSAIDVELQDSNEAALMNYPHEKQSDLRLACLRTACLRALAACLMSACFLAGCGDGGDLSGQLLLEGQPVPGELVFEPLTKENKSAGQSVTVYADATGRFQTLLPETADASQLRIVIRATPVSPEGVPSSFDSQGLPEKVVTLVRTLPVDMPLVFALTR
jgi:hypothetical protein